MRGGGAGGGEEEEQQQSRVFYELCALLFTVLRSPHVAIPSLAGSAAPAAGQVVPPARRRRVSSWQQLSPAAVASLMLGMSMALMLCGSVTFVIGFIMMPWVVGLGMVFCFFGFVSTISGLGKAIFCPAPSAVVSLSSPKEMNGHFFTNSSHCSDTKRQLIER